MTLTSTRIKNPTSSPSGRNLQWPSMLKQWSVSWMVALKYSTTVIQLEMKLERVALIELLNSLDSSQPIFARCSAKGKDRSVGLPFLATKKISIKPIKRSWNCSPKMITCVAGSPLLRTGSLSKGSPHGCAGWGTANVTRPVRSSMTWLQAAKFLHQS